MEHHFNFTHEGAEFEMIQVDDTIFTLKLKNNIPGYRVVTQIYNEVAFLDGKWLLVWWETYLILKNDNVMVKMAPVKQFDFQFNKKTYCVL
jgi:hypothetical protein